MGKPNSKVMAFVRYLVIVAVAFLLVALGSYFSGGDSSPEEGAHQASQGFFGNLGAARGEEKPPEEREIACWGDSLTAGIGAGDALINTDEGTIDVSGQSYPDVLGTLTGLSTYNYGVPGATSEDLVMLQRGKIPERLAQYSFALCAEVTAMSSVHPGDILILEIGSNGGWEGDYDLLILQYKAMILRSGASDYLIIGDTDDPGTSLGDLAQGPFEEGEGPGETDWEAALRQEFGDRFINMRAYLIEHGLEVAGLEPLPTDAADASYGLVSIQLRSDWTHLNSYGYYAQAVGVYERGIELGFWE